ncbi:SHOCT domain-containing protein [Anoxybacterium hadale]|uniref:SHOCT domain-containing protein n=1 Tax=Anoxybacterium hadale TaxID=3408580 RepID=A0ACD1AC86_9FIRM|nr:SHOCT domain-containing protein [Clostridiales bacterium]
MGSTLFGALIAGLIIGAIPAIAGGVKGKLGLGIGGFAACVGGSLLLGMLLSIPLCAIFMFLIFKNNSENSKTNIAHTSLTDSPPNEEGRDALEQIQKLSDLKDSGALTEEEFQQKKALLLSKI